MGVVILDGTGRRLFNTSTSLASQLAVDAAWSQPASESIVFVPAALTTSSSPPVASAGDDEDDKENVWDDTVTTRKSAGSVVVQIERRGLRYVLPVSAADVDPIVPLQYLVSLHEVFEAYIGGQATESAIKDHFDLILCLISHTITPDGRPISTNVSQLKEMVPIPGRGIDKVVSAVNQAGLNAPAPSNANLLIASPLPWRRTGIRYSSNEIYFDLIEELSFLLSSTGQILYSNIDGKISTRSKLSGMPDLELAFADTSALSSSKEGASNVSLHPCVRSSRWTKDQIVSFVPPDGHFDLLYYSLPFASSSSAATISSAQQQQQHVFPLTARATSTSGSLGGSLSISLSPRRRLSNIVISASLPPGATHVTLAESASSSSSSSKAHFEVVQAVDDHPVSSSAATRRRQSAGRQIVKWTLLDGSLEPLPGSRSHTITILFQHATSESTDTATDSRLYNDNDDDVGSLRPIDERQSARAKRRVDSVDLAFDLPDETVSNVRVQSVKLVNQDAGYSLYKGLKNRSRARGTIRCR